MLVAWLISAVEARKAARAKREFERGFDYAAGALLKSIDVDDLEAECDGAFGPSAFDDGMEAAIVAWGQHFSPQEPIFWPEITA